MPKTKQVEVPNQIEDLKVFQNIQEDPLRLQQHQRVFTAVVSRDLESDYLLGVFTTKEKAIEAIQQHLSECENIEDVLVSVQKWELDAPISEKLNYVYLAWVNEDGKLASLPTAKGGCHRYDCHG